MCFAWSILASLHPAKGSCSYRVHHYRPYLQDINIKDLDFPLSVKQVEKVEKQNNISVNVFGYESENEGKPLIFPLHITKTDKLHHVNLLLITEEDKTHYVYIKSMSRLLNHRNTKRHYCPYCLHAFVQAYSLHKHRETCLKDSTYY